MKVEQNLTYYFIGILLFLGLKWMLRGADNDQLLFLLTPVNNVVSLVFNSSSIYSSAQGFFHESLDMAIDKSCAGSHFWLLCFLMLYFSMLPYFRHWSSKWMLLFTSLSIAYLASLFVNSSRIILLIIIENGLNYIHPIIHQAVGIFIYLSFLILIYLTSIFLITKIVPPNEKLA